MVIYYFQSKFEKKDENFDFDTCDDVGWVYIFPIN